MKRCTVWLEEKVTSPNVSILLKWIQDTFTEHFSTFINTVPFIQGKGSSIKNMIHLYSSYITSQNWINYLGSGRMKISCNFIVSWIKNILYNNTTLILSSSNGRNRVIPNMTIFSEFRLFCLWHFEKCVIDQVEKHWINLPSHFGGKPGTNSTHENFNSSGSVIFVILKIKW